MYVPGQFKTQKMLELGKQSKIFFAKSLGGSSIGH